METHYCEIKSFSGLYMCQAEKCYAQQLCCKSCFQQHHVSLEKNVKVQHQFVKFDQSLYFQNLNRLFKLQKLLLNRISKNLQSFKTNYAYNALSALCQSEFFKQIFQDDENITYYSYLRELYLQKPIVLYYPIKESFIQRLRLVTQSKIAPYRDQLIQQSAQWQFLNSQFNLLMGTNSLILENFLANQQQYFIQYCQQITEKKEIFSIYNYLQYRKANSQSIPINPIYFSTDFTSFLVEKYQKNSEQQTIFQVNEYFNNFWMYFSVLVFKNVNAEAYFDFQVDSYFLYAEQMQGIGIDENLLGFRMWKTVNKNSYEILSKLNNHYFYQIFILSFIDLIIREKRINKIILKSWRQYIVYLKDFTLLSIHKKQTVVNINHYGDYFLFRRQNQKFISHLKVSSQIVYDHKVAVNYLNEVFSNLAKPSLKKYRVFLEDRQKQEKTKAQQFIEKSKIMQKQLRQEEKEKFYQNIFVNFIAHSKEQNRPLTTEQYYIFKTKVLSEIDQEYIRSENQRAIEEFKNLVQEEQQIQPEISQVINQIQEGLERKLLEDEQYSDEDNIIDSLKLCLCCQGKPYQCKTQECQLMGCCVACVLG